MVKTAAKHVLSFHCSFRAGLFFHKGNSEEEVSGAKIKSKEKTKNEDKIS